jgi:putative N6-adenine-specific DNA methylase
MDTIIKTINGPDMMNLDKRIKRHVIGARHAFFAVTLPGFENLAQQELEGLCPAIEFGAQTKGGAAFYGRLTDLYLASLHLQTAGRILMRLAAFKATGFSQLEKQTRALAWSLYLPSGDIPQFNITAHHSRLYHTQAVAERIRKNIAAHWTELGIPSASSKDQTLFVRLVDDAITISLDSSGENLYRRGLKTHASQAPIRETLAALILRTAGYDPTLPLVDPMCGAGTFSLEAALMAKSVAPGLHRRFAFMQWPAFRPQQWQYLKNSATRKIRHLDRPIIWASDMDAGACARLSTCVSRNNLGDAIRVSQKDFFSLHSNSFGRQPGLIVLNPPYGLRLPAETAGQDLYRRIAAKLRQDFKGWQAALLVPDKRLADSLNLPFKPYYLDHGGLKLILLTGHL